MGGGGGGGYQAFIIMTHCYLVMFVEEVIQQKKGTKNTAMQTEDTPKEETASTGSVAHVGECQTANGFVDTIS